MARSEISALSICHIYCNNDNRATLRIAFSSYIITLMGHLKNLKTCSTVILTIILIIETISGTPYRQATNKSHCGPHRHLKQNQIHYNPSVTHSQRVLGQRECIHLESAAWTTKACSRLSDRQHKSVASGAWRSSIWGAAVHCTGRAAQSHSTPVQHWDRWVHANISGNYSTWRLEVKINKSSYSYRKL